MKLKKNPNYRKKLIINERKKTKRIVRLPRTSGVYSIKQKKVC